MSKRTWIAAITAGWLCAFAILAAEPDSLRYNVDNISKGLPSQAILATIQTRDGYLWLGTLGGLVRFDGLHFTVFDESNTPGLNSSRIVKLFEDSHTNLWIGTEASGVAVVKSGRVTSVEGTREAPLVAISEDVSGGVWLYLANGQLLRYRDGKVDVRVGNCRGVVAEDSGLVWVGTQDGRLIALGPIQASTSSAFAVAHEVPVGQINFLLSSKHGGYWRLVNGRIQKCKANRVERDWPYPWTSSVAVAAACEDNRGNLIVGTDGDGVYWFDAEGRSTHIRGLSHGSIPSLVVDREGCLWVGTNGKGVDRVRRLVFEVEGSTGYTTQSTCPDDKGGVWVGYAGNRVSYVNGDTRKQFRLARGGDADSLVDVKAVFVTREQRILAGTWSGSGEWSHLFELKGDQFEPIYAPDISRQNISAIYQGRDGRMWFGTQGGLVRWDEKGWKTFGPADGLSVRNVRAIMEDGEGNLWVGTQGGGLNRFRDGQFTVFSRTNGFPSDNISSLYLDTDGVLWVGTEGGLVRFKAGKWTHYTHDQGLIINNLGYILEDKEGYLWIGSTAGLMRVEKKSLNQYAQGSRDLIFCHAYGEREGLPARECTQGSQPGATREKSGRLLFPTIGGLAAVDPARLVSNTNIPPVLIEAVLVDGESAVTNGFRTHLPPTITIPPGKERLEVRFTGLNLAGADKARFRYRLEGHEDTWTEVLSDIRSAYYTKLPPGDYRFHVIACNEDGLWNRNGDSLGITVEPPFWRTWWFRSGIALALLGMIIGSVYFVSTQKLQRQLASMRQQEAIENERARIARDLHDQLGANLTQVALLGEMAESDKDSPKEVQAHAQQISQTARDTTHALDEIVWTVNPRNDTLDSLVTYVCKYAQDYLGLAGLRYRLEVPSQLPATPISPELRHNVFLAAKEAVNNVVKHAHANAAWLRLRVEPARFTLEIEDNGRGIAAADAKKGRNGLVNMRKRMEDIGGEFAMAPGAEGGTKVCLTAPLKGNGT